MIRYELLSQDNVMGVYNLETICFQEDPWTFKMFEAEINNNMSIYIVGKDEETGNVLSYGGMWLIYDTAEITNIAVHPNYRREGIGNNLLNVLFKTANDRGIYNFNLEVRASNKPAMDMYLKNGFIKCGIRKNYYQGKEDAILMSKIAEE